MKRTPRQWLSWFCNRWYQRRNEVARCRTAMSWAHYALAEDRRGTGALWAMYFLNYAMRPGTDLDGAADRAKCLVRAYEEADR